MSSVSGRRAGEPRRESVDPRDCRTSRPCRAADKSDTTGIRPSPQPSAARLVYRPLPLCHYGHAPGPCHRPRPRSRIGIRPELVETTTATTEPGSTTAVQEVHVTARLAHRTTPRGAQENGGIAVRRCATPGGVAETPRTTRDV